MSRFYYIDFVQWIALLASLMTAVSALATILRSRRRSFTVAAEGLSAKEVAQVREIEMAGEAPIAGAAPFEAAQLAKYYAQVLGQSRVSFWFSLTFASLGFAVIIGAALMYSSDRSGTTVASFVAGVIVDAVSALFFVQSRQANQAMAAFFDKLRLDRERLEARALAEIISDARAKDAVRIQLTLHLAGITESRAVAEAIISATLSVPHSAPAA